MVNVYIYQADIYCEACGEEIISDMGGKRNCPALVDSNVWPDGPYDNGGGEADCPQHCGACGLFLENPLTSDGEAYVREASARSDVPEWRAFYDYL